MTGPPRRAAESAVIDACVCPGLRGRPAPSQSVTKIQRRTKLLQQSFSRGLLCSTQWCYTGSRFRTNEMLLCKCQPPGKELTASWQPQGSAWWKNINYTQFASVWSEAARLTAFYETSDFPLNVTRSFSCPVAEEVQALKSSLAFSLEMFSVLTISICPCSCLCDTSAALVQGLNKTQRVWGETLPLYECFWRWLQFFALQGSWSRMDMRSSGTRIILPGFQSALSRWDQSASTEEVLAAMGVVSVWP